MVRKKLPEKVTFEQILEENKGIAYMFIGESILGNTISGIRNVLGSLRNSGEASVSREKYVRLGLLRNIRVVLQSSCWALVRDLVFKIVRWEALGGF